METCVLFCCLGTTDRKETELHSRHRHSDSRTAEACGSHPDHVLLCCLGTMDRKEMELHSWHRHSDSRSVEACGGHPDHVWTWILACKNFLERSWSLPSYASNLKSVSCLTQPQSSFFCRDLFLPAVMRHLILTH
jgi:hypothetical protein